MISIKKRKHGIDFYKVWFAEKPFEKKGIIAYQQSFIQSGNDEVFDTLVSDITKEPEEIKNGFAKNCKYEVNRASRENIRVKQIDGNNIEDKDIDDFVSFFSDFWKSKNMELDSPNDLRDEMRQYRDIDALGLSMAYVNEKPAVYHTYVCDDTRTRLWHSASLYRLLEGDEKEGRKLTGMANRYLHYMDMLHYKEKGLSTYDWGGAGQGEDVHTITEFKKSFGGIPEKNYNYEEVKGIKANLFRFVVNATDDVLLSAALP